MLRLIGYQWETGHSRGGPGDFVRAAFGIFHLATLMLALCQPQQNSQRRRRTSPKAPPPPMRGVPPHTDQDFDRGRNPKSRS